MAIKDLLVAYQGDEGSQKALKFAIQMGAKYGATVTGLHVQAGEPLPGQYRRWIPEDVLETMRLSEQDAIKAIERSFHETAAASQAKAESQWIAVDGAPGVLLARMSRYFDILITGQFEGAIQHGGRAVQPEELIRRIGKPMIIVPQNYEVRPFKEEAVVAWDGSASAARALTDAMQILETKKRLDVVMVETDDENRAKPPGDHDIISHLQRHGIDAHRVPLKRTGTVGRTILAYCEETQPDVLVMGAFGRFKLGTILFGTVSNYILEHQNVPVLMSH